MTTAMPVAGELVRVTPRVRRLTQNNPSLFTGSGTNTHLIGTDRELFVLDPGPDDDEHHRKLVEAIGSARVLGVIVSHSHADHWPLAPALAQHFDCLTQGFEARGGYEPQQQIADGEILDPMGLRLEAIHTPGHASDHLCFLLPEEDLLFSGDHVMGWSTTVISPPDGNLLQYMVSLDRLERHPHRLMVPAHGFPIDEPMLRIDELRRHRQQRTSQALEALEAGPSDIPALVERIYADVDRRLHSAAQWSLLAHLQALVEDGRVRVTTQGGGAPMEDHYELV